MSYYVYTLSDPRTNIVYYVGITFQPEVRYRQHLADSDSNDKKCDWIQSLLSDHLQPRMDIVETCNDEQTARAKEWSWIRACLGNHLTNIRHNPLASLKPTDQPITNQQILESRYGDAYYPLDFILHPLYLDDEWKECQALEGFPTGTNLQALLYSFYLSFGTMYEVIGDDGMNHIEEWYNQKLVASRAS